MGADRSRPGAARDGAESVSAGRLRQAGSIQRPSDSPLAGLLLPQFPPGGDRRGGSARDPHAHLRHRSGARFEDRRVLRAGRQRAHAERYFLRAREPPGDDSRSARRVPGLRGAAGEPLSGGTCPDSAQPFTARRSGGADRAAHARHIQQRLLRAQLPSAADGNRAGGGAGPDRGRRHRLHEDDPRAEARGRDLPPRGR